MSPYEQPPSGRAATCVAHAGEHCVTCADEALPATVLRVDEAANMAVVAVADGTEEVDISLVGPVCAGQRVLIHAGVAIAQEEPA